MSVGVAILGSGIFVREEHLPAVEACNDLTLKAIYSRSLKSAKALETSVDLYSDDADNDKSLDSLLSRNDIQAVIIALPIKNQPEYIKKALQAGKHVLSEKPVAENVAEAAELIKWYESDIAPKGVTWAVAENARFWNAIIYGAEKRSKLGRALTFRCRMQAFVSPGGKYFETEWRKVPTHQGGFLLDGGVHFIAALRMILGKNEPLVSIAAHTAQLQEHLPPVDTIEATAKTKGGALGNISISFGTTNKGTEYSIGSQEGSVSVSPGSAKIDDKEEKIEEEGSGVAPEIRAWAQGIVNGKSNVLQRPREALADLEVIEACLRSGEQGAKVIELKYQEV